MLRLSYTYVHGFYSGLMIVFKNETYSGNEIKIFDIGESADAVICMTTRTDCCTDKNNETRNGEWYYPNGNKVPTMGDNQDFYRNRRSQQVLLHRRNNASGPLGYYCCELSNGTERICINISCK